MRLGDLSGQVAVPFPQVVVAVPGLALAVPDLHVTDAALDQPAGDEKLPGFDVRAVRFLNVFRFALDVEGVGRFHLHPVGQLEGLDSGLQRGFHSGGVRRGGGSLPGRDPIGGAAPSR